MCGFVVGILSGITGMGGVLIPPFLIVLLDMNPHIAMGTSMASFIPSCCLAIWTHYRSGNIDWTLAVPLCISGVVCVFIGTEFNALMPAYALNVTLAALIIFVGGLAFKPVTRNGPLASMFSSGFFSSKTVQLSILGGAVGILSGMTGTGGPVLSVPIMLAMGYQPLAAIACGLVYSLPVSIAGTIGNVLHDSVNFSFAALCAAGQVAGVQVGFRIARFCNAQTLKYIVAGVCIMSGLVVLIKAIWV